MDRPLNEYDAAEVAGVLIGVSHKAEILGRLLKVPKATVSTIRREYPHSVCERLLHIIDEVVLSVEEPRATWKSVCDALRSPLVQHHRLAREIEKKFGPCPQTEGVVSYS